MSIEGQVFIPPMPTDIKICLTAFLFTFLFHLMNESAGVGIMMHIAKAGRFVSAALFFIALLHMIWTA